MCTGRAGITINEPDSLKITITDTADITVTSDGKVVVEASGGSPPYVYTLQPNGTQQILGTFTFESGDSGLYVVEVDDSQGCGPIATDTFEIKETFECLAISIDNVHFENVNTCYGDNTGSISIEVSGGFRGTMGVFH